MKRYSSADPLSEEPGEEATPASRAAGLAIALVGALIMGISILEGWVPWSL
jgi:hypothetical protein